MTVPPAAPAVRASLALSALNSYLGLALQLATTAYVARILSPYETGVFAVAAVFAALASNFRDFGVAEYLVQRAQVSADVLRASLAVNLAASWAMAVVLLAASPWLAAFYREPGVGNVMRVQALSFVLIPFGAVTLAWYRRELDFRPIFRANVAGHLASALTVVTLVAAGQGYMAPAWASVAGVAATVAVAIGHRPPWFPRWPSFTGTREAWHFGRFASGVFVTTQAGKSAPDLVIGRVSGMADVGLFSRANGLVEVFNRLVLNVVLPVCLPYLADGVRRDGSVLPNLTRAACLLTGVGWPCLALLALAAFPAIRAMYGPQWTDAVGLAQVLCLAAAVELLHRLTDETLFSLGKAREAHRLQMAVQGLRAIGVMAVLPWGLQGAAWGLLTASLLGVGVCQRELTRHAGLRGAHTWAAIVPSARLTAICAAPVAALVLAVPPDESNFVAVGVVAGLLGMAAWVMGVRWLEHPAWQEIRRLLGKRSGQPLQP